MRGLVFATFVLSVLISNPVAEVQYGPPRSPIHWNPVPKNANYLRDYSPQFEKLQAYKINALTPSRVELNTLSDDVELGISVRNRPVWLLSYLDLPIHNERLGQVVHILINIAIDAESGRLLLAFTQPNDHWVVPVDSERSPDDENKVTQWQIEPVIPDSISHGIAEVIASIWRDADVDPTTTGQIILRPRIVGRAIPPIATKDEQGRIVYGEVVYIDEPTWIVEVKGTKMKMSSSHFGDDYYSTALIGLVDDATKMLYEFNLLP